MIYAKVSENEHITSEARKEILNQLGWVLDNIKYEYLREKSNKISKKDTMLESFLSISASIILLAVFFNYFSGSKIANQYPIYAIPIILCVTAFVLYYLRPLINSILEKLMLKENDTKNNEIVINNNLSVIDDTIKEMKKEIEKAEEEKKKEKQTVKRAQEEPEPEPEKIYDSANKKIEKNKF